MRRIAAFLASEIDVWIAPGIVIVRRMLVVFGLKALVAGPGLIECPIECKVFIADKAGRTRLFNHKLKELLRNLTAQESLQKPQKDLRDLI